MIAELAILTKRRKSFVGTIDANMKFFAGKSVLTGIETSARGTHLFKDKMIAHLSGNAGTVLL